MSRLRSERGAVTAELAMAIPLVLALTVGLVWLLAVAASQVRVIDAARETARAVARGDAANEALLVGRRIAPDGAELEITRSAGRVEVVASAEVSGPGGLFDGIGDVAVSASAVAIAEEGG